MLEDSRHPYKAKSLKIRSIQAESEGYVGKKIENAPIKLKNKVMRINQVPVTCVKQACCIDPTLSRPRGLATVTKFNQAPPQAPYDSVAKGHGRLVSAAAASCAAWCSKAFILVDC